MVSVFENLKAGWRLGRETRKLIMADRQLFIYPVISAIIGIVLFALLVVSWVFINATTPFQILTLFLFYVASYFTSTYVIIAMLIAFRSHSQGNRISMGEAFSQANQYWKLVLEWAIFDAIITTIIRVIESRFRFDFITRLIIGSVVAFAFSVATFFVVPVIIDEKVGPIKAIKTSTKFIIDNFGKTFGGFIYTDIYTLAFILGGIAVMVLGFVVLSSSLLIPGIVVMAAGFLLFIFGMIFNYVLGNTLKLIIYDYMTDRGKLPKGWDKGMIDDALKRKPQRPSVVQSKFSSNESFA